MKVLWGGLAWLFTCVASCSFASDLDANFKFGLAFALVLIVLLCLLRHRRRGHLRCCVFCFCYGVVCFLSSPSSLHRSVLSFGWDFATSHFLEVEDNYPENLPDFYFCALLYRCDVATYDLLKKWKKTNWTIFHKMGSQSLLKI